MNLQNGKLRTDAFRTKFVRKVMKIPLMVCKSKYPMVVRTTQYKSKELVNYKESFLTAYKAVTEMIYTCPEARKYVRRGERRDFIDFCALHFPV